MLGVVALLVPPGINASGSSGALYGLAATVKGNLLGSKVKVGLGWFPIAPLVWERFNGCLPEGWIVRRTCNTHLCCAPDHLLAGTRADLARWQGVGLNWRPQRAS